MAFQNVAVRTRMGRCASATAASVPSLLYVRFNWFPFRSLMYVSWPVAPRAKWNQRSYVDRVTAELFDFWQVDGRIIQASGDPR